jgi:hypothetical protein
VPHLIIGPSNSAGQAWEWARAVERNLPPAVAESLMAGAGDFRFSADHTVSTEKFSADAGWLVGFADHVLRHATHVLFEAARPILGQPRGQFFLQDVPTLRSAGIAMGLVFHGSEVRDPRAHRARHPHSPFLRPDDPLTQRLQAATDIVRRHADEFVDGPKYVTTPDLLDYVEGSQWLPVVVDAERLASNHPVLERARPVVLHAPSRSALKGSGYVDPVLRRLDERGLVEYRRVEAVSHADLIALVKEADIVVDQLLLGSYGVFACEAMAAGRVTVGHVAEHVRAQLPRRLPIVEATPDEFEAVIERILGEREVAAKDAGEGPEYVRALHDGRESARVLASFLMPAS